MPDSEGAGAPPRRARLRVVYGPKEWPMTIAYTFEGHENPAQGVRGGRAGAPSDGWKIDRAGNRVDVPMAAAMEIIPGERVLSRTGGGGGYGDPLTRDPDAVCEDVREGWVARERARNVYGVILVDADETAHSRLVVDAAATEAERERRRTATAPAGGEPDSSGR